MEHSIRGLLTRKTVTSVSRVPTTTMTTISAVRLSMAILALFAGVRHTASALHQMRVVVDRAYAFVETGIVLAAIHSLFAPITLPAKGTHASRHTHGSIECAQLFGTALVLAHHRV